MVLYVSLRLHDMLHLLEESHVISVDLLVALLLKLQKMERSVLCACSIYMSLGCLHFEWQCTKIIVFGEF